jgi:hypothetical protein
VRRQGGETIADHDAKTLPAAKLVGWLGEGAVDDVFLWSGICLEDERDKKWDGEGRKC